MARPNDRKMLPIQSRNIGSLVPLRRDNHARVSSAQREIPVLLDKLTDSLEIALVKRHRFIRAMSYFPVKTSLRASTRELTQHVASLSNDRLWYQQATRVRPKHPPATSMRRVPFVGQCDNRPRINNDHAVALPDFAMRGRTMSFTRAPRSGSPSNTPSVSNSRTTGTSASSGTSCHSATHTASSRSSGTASISRCTSSRVAMPPSYRDQGEHRVFRVSFPGQGGPCGAAYPALILSNRQTRACGWRRSRAAVRHRPGDPAAAAREKNMPSPGGQVSGMVGKRCRVRSVGGHVSPSHRPPRGLSRRVKGAVPSSGGGWCQGAPLTRRDRATPGRRDGEKAPHLQGEDQPPRCKISGTPNLPKPDPNDDRRPSLSIVNGRLLWLFMQTASDIERG